MNEPSAKEANKYRLRTLLIVLALGPRLLDIPRAANA